MDFLKGFSMGPQGGGIMFSHSKLREQPLLKFSKSRGSLGMAPPPPFQCPCLGVSSVCLLTVPFERTLFSNSPPDTLRCKLHCYFVSCLKTVHISFLLIALQYCWPGDDGKICKTPERSQRGEFWPNTKRDDPRSPFRTHRPN